ncbi:hypothetical protein CPC08DRAFT_110778 [Agrocybe pediades]|nr:hypothetical protein CPC08DRAFT_110778 [Agrocybe pediades]
MEHQNARSNNARRNTEPNLSTFLNDPTLDAKEQIELIDNEIMRVEGQIVRLVKHRAFLKRRRNTFSPAVKLPPEILAHIFEYACHPNGGEFGDRYYTYFPSSQLVGGINLGLSVGVGAVTPLFIGTICSAWRNVSKGASQLWSTLTIHMNNRNADAQASLLRSWLQLSGNRPLAIKLLEDDTTETEHEEEDGGWGIDVSSTAVIKVLAEHAPQWHTIDFFLPSTWRTVLSRVKHRLPMLRNATLRVAESCPTMVRVDAFAYAPQLQEVHLVGYSIADVNLPWAQLNRLDGEYFGVDECLETLRRCTDLQVCQFERAYRGTRPFDAFPITHTTLQSFELIMDSADDLPALFGAMTLPNLKEIVLSFSDDEPMLREIRPLIRRSNCVLQHVHLVGLTPEEDDLLDFLKELPMLQVFMLINPVTETGGRLTTRFLDALMPNKRGIAAASNDANDDDVDMMQSDDSHDEAQYSCLVPRLQRLEYQGAIGFTPHELLQFLISRWRLPTPHSPSHSHPNPTNALPSSPHPHKQQPPISQLRAVSLTTTRRIRFDSADSQTVQALMDEGMFLEFLDDPNAGMY